MQRGELVSADLVWLLRLPAHKFWSQIQFDANLQVGPPLSKCFYFCSKQDTFGQVRPREKSLQSSCHFFSVIPGSNQPSYPQISPIIKKDLMNQNKISYSKKALIALYFFVIAVSSDFYYQFNQGW